MEKKIYTQRYTKRCCCCCCLKSLCVIVIIILCTQTINAHIYAVWVCYFSVRFVIVTVRCLLAMYILVFLFLHASFLYTSFLLLHSSATFHSLSRSILILIFSLSAVLVFNRCVLCCFFCVKHHINYISLLHFHRLYWFATLLLMSTQLVLFFRCFFLVLATLVLLCTNVIT